MITGEKCHPKGQINPIGWTHGKIQLSSSYLWSVKTLSIASYSYLTDLVILNIRGQYHHKVQKRPIWLTPGSFWFVNPQWTLENISLHKGLSQWVYNQEFNTWVFLKLCGLISPWVWECELPCILVVCGYKWFNKNKGGLYWFQW